MIVIVASGIGIALVFSSMIQAYWKFSKLKEDKNFNIFFMSGKRNKAKEAAVFAGKAVAAGAFGKIGWDLVDEKLKPAASKGWKELDAKLKEVAAKRAAEAAKPVNNGESKEK
jgi:hypothetical protein